MSETLVDGPEHETKLIDLNSLKRQQTGFSNSDCWFTKFTLNRVSTYQGGRSNVWPVRVPASWVRFQLKWLDKQESHLDHNERHSQDGQLVRILADGDNFCD